MLRRFGLAPLVVLSSVAATGWLYSVRPGIPGPRIGEALPLDELSRHSSAPLAWFVLVWLTVAAVLGLYARWARVDRLTAALLLGIAVGAFTYLETAVSIAVVRQVAMRDALDAAARLKVVYLAATLVAIGAAALARPRSFAGRGPAVVAALVAVGAGLDVLWVVLPGPNRGLLHSLTPDAFGPFARAAGALTAIALLLAARGLARRRRRAWQVASALAAVSTTLHVLHGFNDGTLASAVVLVVLVARRNDFDRPGDTATRHLILSRIVVVACVIAAYGSLALWLNRLAADQSFTAGFAARELFRGLFALEVRGSPHLAGMFGDWFPLSLFLLGAAGTLWVVAGWLAPWRHRVTQLERERQTAQALVRAFGADTLAPFVLRADKSYFFTDDESAFLAYRVVGGVAIVSGDPIGPPNRADELMGRFVAHAHRRDWRVAILGASEAWLPQYAQHGLHALYHGDEAIVDTESFSLDGRPIRKVRQSVHRLQNAGFVSRTLRPSDIDSQLREELEALADEWRGDKPERGFVMALDALFSLGDEDALFVVGFHPDGSAAGFLHFAISNAAGALSLSSMPRLRRAPNGFNEWLISAAIAWAREHGYARVSLNFAPFAALLAPEAELSALQGVQRKALLALKGQFQLDNLLMFNRKFFPRWERRFVVYEHRRDLPRVGLAALAAEAYLPFQSARR